jgi:hypothetical protein|tara:strand:+ start:841 stop:1095 length:255 start_codon:yes stop_codon:yes gene_type:complete
MIKELKDNLLQVNLLNQSIVELLIEKEILTKEEVEERLLHNQKLFMQTAREFAKLISEADKLKRKVQSTDDELLEMYFGPIGQA